MDSDTPFQQSFNINWLAGVGLALIALLLYILTLAPTVLEADGGEFQFVPWLPGIAHPTGYPLYVLLGWLWTHILPVGEVAWRMNLLSAVIAAATVGLTYAVARRLGDIVFSDTPPLARILAAAVSAVTLAVTPTFWSQAIIAEVYALHAFFVAAILGLALNFRRPKCGQSLGSGILLAFTFGLGLTHHSTTILLLPGLILYLWATQQLEAAVMGGSKALIMYGLAAIAPLLLYLSLPLLAPSTPYATLSLSNSQTLTLYKNSVAGFLRHVTGAVFTGELQPAAVGVERFFLPWQLLQQQVGWTGIILAALGLFFLGQQRQIALLLLTGVTALTFVAFNLIYFIGDVFVLFIPVWLIVCLWLGIGTLALSHWIARRFVRRKLGPKEGIVFESMWERINKNMYQLVISIMLLFFFALPVVLGITHWPQVDQSTNTIARERWQKILQQPILKSAILLSNDRNEIMPMWYYQYVEGNRPDLMGLFPLIVNEPAYANAGRVLDQALISSRPVYLIKSMDGLSLKANITPEGTLFRATSYQEPPAYTAQVLLPEITLSAPSGELITETIMLTGYDVSSEIISPGDEITITLHWQPTQELSFDYTSYVHILSADDSRVAQSDHQPGGVYYPGSYWQPGEVLRDAHTLTIPADVPPGVYWLRAGMYYQPEPGIIKGMGNGVKIGQLAVKACC